jgi:hypothetical protein
LLLSALNGRDEQPSRDTVSAMPGQGDIMSQAQWFLFGAVMIGIVVFVYLMFFCPTDCR